MKKKMDKTKTDECCKFLDSLVIETGKYRIEGREIEFQGEEFEWTNDVWCSEGNEIPQSLYCNDIETAKKAVKELSVIFPIHEFRYVSQFKGIQ